MHKKFLFVQLFLALLLLGMFAVTPTAVQAQPNPGHLIIDTIGMPETVDPAWAYDTASGALIMQVYDTLIWNSVNDSATDNNHDGDPCSDEMSKATAGKMFLWDMRIASACNNLILNEIQVNDPTPCYREKTLTEGFDPYHYNFTIREDCLWHEPHWETDVGDDGYVDIYDVEYSIERLLVQDRSGGPEPLLYEPLFGVGTYHADLTDPEWMQKIDDAVTVDPDTNTVQFNLPAPYPPFMNILTQTWASVMCKEWAVAHGCWNGTHTMAALEKWHDPEKPPLDTDQDISGDPFKGGYMMGSGPYMFDYWDHPAYKWSVVRFPDYYGGWGERGYNVPEGKWLERMTEREVDEWADRKLCFIAGDSDLTYVPRAHTHELDGIEGLRALYPTEAMNIRCLFFNEKIANTSLYVGTGELGEDGIPLDFFGNIHVRRAFASLFNSTLFLEEVLLGEGMEISACIPPTLKYYNETIPKWELNLTKAKEEFMAATFDGQSLWDVGFTVTLTYNTGNEERERACRIVVDNLDAMCTEYDQTKFHASVKAADWPTYLGNLVGGELSLFTLGWTADFPDDHNFVFPFMHSEGDFAGFQAYNNSHVDELIELEIMTPDGPARKKIFDELQQIFHDDAPSVPLPWAYGRHWERDWVQGWCYNPLWFGYYAYHLWKEWYTPPSPPPAVSTSTLYGTNVPISGSFIDPTTEEPAVGYLVLIQQSLDNVTWINIAAAVTDENGCVNASVTPTLGTSYYRLNFTGYTVPAQVPIVLSAKYYEQLIENKTLPLVLPSEIGTSIEVETKTLEDILTETLTPLATKDDLDSLSSEISDLRSSIDSLTTLLYASIIIAVIAIIVAIVPLIRKGGASPTK